MTQFFVSKHAVRRYRQRNPPPWGTPRQRSVIEMIHQVAQAPAQTLAKVAKSSGMQVVINGDVYTLKPLWGTKGDAFLICTYYNDELRGWPKVKHRIKSVLTYYLNQW